MFTEGYDVIVIGGGIVGCATALYTARRKRRVLLLEAEHCARHASGASAGGIRCLNRLIEEIPLSLAAQEMWPELETDLGFECGFRATSQIRIAENSADLTLLEERAELTRSLGFRHEEIIDRAELRRLVPAVADNCVGALLCRKDGYTKPINTTHAYRKRAQAEGVRILERHPVEAVNRDGDSWQVRTPHGNFSAEALFNCAGSWGGRISSMVGDEAPVQAAALALMVSDRIEHFIDPVIGVANRKLSLKQMQNGTVVIGGALRAELTSDHAGTMIDFAQMRESAKTVREVFPHLKTVPIVHAWAGIEGVMPDKLPVIGPSINAPGVFHAFGFSAHGLQLAPIVGVVMADLLSRGCCEFDLAPFAVERFAT